MSFVAAALSLFKKIPIVAAAAAPALASAGLCSNSLVTVLLTDIAHRHSWRSNWSYNFQILGVSVMALTSAAHVFVKWCS